MRFCRWYAILLIKRETAQHLKTMTNTTWRFIGREGKAYLVTDGIRTKYLTAQEFRTFTWN